MIISDPVYGTFDVDAPVLAELIKSEPVQRLKGIDQLGIYEFTRFPRLTRYEHSVGTMLLLKKVGAALDEQIAGLLHDVSHTAFSHLYDWVAGDSAKEDHQDRTFETFLYNSEIPKILRKHNYAVEDFLDLKDFTLLEQPSPDVCADRFDYTIREIKTWAADAKTASLCVNSLVDRNGALVFDSKEAAKAFAYGYMKCEMEHWSGTDNVVRRDLLSRVLKHTLAENLIELEDFMRDDEFIMEKVRRSDNADTKKWLNVLSGEIKFARDEENPDVDRKTKCRYVDPCYVSKGSGLVHRVSDFDPQYKEKIEEYKKINAAGVKVRLVA
jgi:hypothetical protein